MQNFSPLSILVHDQARVYGNRTALRYRDYSVGIWKDISWNEFSSRVRELSNAMLSIGVEEQENMAVFSQNMPEVLMVDFAAYAIRAVTIPMYATSSEMQVKYIVSDASIRYIFVGEQEQYDIAFRVLKLGSSLEKLIIFDRNVQRNPEDNISIYLDDFRKGHDNRYEEEIERRTKTVQSQDLANILYTSGTTGLSKGVMLTHEMYNSALSAHYGVLPLSDKDIILNFLPFTHVLERGWSYLCIANGCTMAVNLRPADVLQSLREVHPTCMCAVPRFWEKVYAGVQERMEKSSPMQKLLLEDALRVGHAYNVDYKMKGITPPIGLRMQYSLYENTIIAFLKKQLGLERANFFPTAGAAVPTVIEDFVRSAGLNMVVGYGLTESTATVSIDRLGMPISIGSVGRLLDGVEIKFGENDEILLKGKTITKGYYRKAEVTELSIDQDGWFHTGDAGYIKDGELFLTDRIKDLFKTSNGKYISPQLIESKLCVDKYIDQIVVVAEQRKFVSALVIPQYDLLMELAKDYGVECHSNEELCTNPRVVKFMMYRIETLQQEFAHYEQIKKITLLPEPFSMEKGELTDTLKVKRAVLYKNYREQIEKMYEEE
ncbi:MAG: AMP-dependent synthetase/ligase [Bacteroidaceae bacterium]|jgi:long-chain acyl-CoA synthetase|nr:AMP-dependent synthetase/ligase [Bacteroidaceae bacterium]